MTVRQKCTQLSKIKLSKSSDGKYQNTLSRSEIRQSYQEWKKHFCGFNTYILIIS